MPRSNGPHRRNGHANGNGHGTPRPAVDFDRDQLVEIRENREKHVLCMDLCRRKKDDLTRIAREGPRSGDEELLKAAAALALWELREQQFLRRMYLDDRPA